MVYIFEEPSHTPIKVQDLENFDLTFYKAIKQLRIHFGLNFIPILKRRNISRIKSVAFGIAYTLLTFTCLLSFIPCIRTRLGFYVFQSIMKLITLTTYWIVYYRRRKIENLIKKIYVLRSFMENQRFQTTMLNFSICLILASTLIPSFYHVFAGSYKTFRCDLFGIEVESDYIVAARNFIWLMAEQHIDWGINYAIAIVFCFCCRQMSRIIGGFCLKNRNFSSHEIRCRYKSLRSSIKCIEKTFSICLLIFLGRSFFEFFKILSYSLDKIELTVDIKFAISAAVYSSVTLIVFISVIMSADILQNDFKCLCERLLQSFVENADFSNGFVDLKFMLAVSEDRKQMRLTAGGIFQLKKGLLLTTAASFFSYGIVMRQFKKEQ